MTISTSLTAAIAAASLVGVIGLAYAQSSTDGSTPQAQQPNRAAAMGATSDTNIGQAPATNTGSMPATMPTANPATMPAANPAANSGAMPSTMPAANSATMPANTPSYNTDSGMRSSNTNGDANGTMTERAARTDRN